MPSELVRVMELMMESGYRIWLVKCMIPERYRKSLREDVPFCRICERHLTK